MTGPARGVLTGLNVYPLKSGGGTSPESAELVATGLRHDREFMLVAPGGRMISQREHPELALLRPSFDGRTLRVAVSGREGALIHEATGDGPVTDVTVHRTQCQGIDQGDEPARWFSAVLGTECRLMRFTGTRHTGRGGGVVAYADGYPLLLISAESLDDLNTRLAARAADGDLGGGAGLPMNRFRPSLVVEGLGAYGEDSVRTLRIGAGAVIELVKPCARCLITTTDQETAVRGREPLRTLATYRTIDRGIMFGQNGIPRALGTLRVGDPVEVIEYADGGDR